MKFRSHCKINLFLHILGKREDDYHELESLFYFPEIYDEIEIVERSGAKGQGSANNLEINGKFADELKDDNKNNIILKTYSLLKILYGAKLPDLSFTLTKNIPVASGVGGGSANAAAVLKALNEKYELGLRASQLYKIGARLGADVPACILDEPCFVQGKGEILNGIEDFPKLHVILVNPGVPVSTAEIFNMGFEKYTSPLPLSPEGKRQIFLESEANLENLDDEDEVNSTPHPAASKLSTLAKTSQPSPPRGEGKIIGSGFKTTQSLIDFLEYTRNDLEPGAKKICPQIGKIIELIGKQNGCLLARMSGSGATCFGIFETKDKALMAQTEIEKSNPGYWVAVG